MNNDFNIDFNRIPLFKIVEKHYYLIKYQPTHRHSSTVENEAISINY